MLRFSDCIGYVGYVVDDSGSARKLGDDTHAIVRQAGSEFKHASRIVGFQCGFEPMCVAVHSYLDVKLNDAEAEEMAIEYLEEIGWFSNAESEHSADFIL